MRYLILTYIIIAGIFTNDSIVSISDSLLTKDDSLGYLSRDTVQFDSSGDLSSVLDTTVSDSADTISVIDKFKEPIKSDSISDDSVIFKKDSTVFPKIVNDAFAVGENLYFKIRYGFIRAGNATMSVKAETTMSNRPVYYIQTTAKSASGFNWIYKVEDLVTSYIDKEGLFSWKFEKLLREGGYKADLFVDYDPLRALANVTFIRYHKDMRIRKMQNYEVKTTPFVLDILAAFYYVRTQKLQEGESIYLTNHEKKKVNKLEVRVYKKETVEVEAGKFECLVVEPLLFGEGIFKQKGRLKVWLTNDQYKIPVQMKSKVIVGSITTELTKIEGIPHPIPAQR